MSLVTNPARTTERRLSAATSVDVIGTVRRVRPFGVPVMPRRVC